MEHSFAPKSDLLHTDIDFATRVPCGVINLVRGNISLNITLDPGTREISLINFTRSGPPESIADTIRISKIPSEASELIHEALSKHDPVRTLAALLKDEIIPNYEIQYEVTSSAPHLEIDEPGGRKVRFLPPSCTRDPLTFVDAAAILTVNLNSLKNGFAELALEIIHDNPLETPGRLSLRIIDDRFHSTIERNARLCVPVTEVSSTIDELIADFTYNVPRFFDQMSAASDLALSGCCEASIRNKAGTLLELWSNCDGHFLLVHPKDGRAVVYTIVNSKPGPLTINEMREVLPFISGDKTMYPKEWHSTHEVKVRSIGLFLAQFPHLELPVSPGVRRVEIAPLCSNGWRDLFGLRRRGMHFESSSSRLLPKFLLTQFGQEYWNNQMTIEDIKKTHCFHLLRDVFGSPRTFR